MTKKGKNPVQRTWLLTLWPEYLDEYTHPIPFYGIFYDTEGIAKKIKDSPSVRYVVCCAEVGEEANHEHFHAYVELITPQRFSFFIKMFGKQHHFEQCQGTQEENIDYVCHSGTHNDKPGHLLNEPVELGSKAKSGVHESGIYGTAIALLLEGYTIPHICRELGGGILSQVGNLCRLRNEIDAENSQNKDVSIIKTKNAALERYISYLEDEYIKATQEEIPKSILQDFYNQSTNQTTSNKNEVEL